MVGGGDLWGQTGDGSGGAAAAGRRWIDVLDYVPADDSLDVTAGVAAALAAAPGREIVFTCPVGQSSRPYRVLTRPTSNLWFLPANSGGRMIFEEGAYIDCSTWSNDTAVDPTAEGRRIFQGTGTLSTSYALTVDAFEMDAKITSPTLAAALAVTPAGGRGKWVILQSDEPFTIEDGSAEKSENLIVERVSGNDIYIKGFLRDTYYVARYSARAYIVTPTSWKFENLSIVGPGRFVSNTSGDRGLTMTYGLGCSIAGANIERVDFGAIAYFGCLGGTLSELDVRQDGNIPTNGKVAFGISLSDGCQGITVRDSNIWGAYQQYVLSGTSILGITRDISFESCNSYGADNAGFSQHSSHESITYSACSVVGCDMGFDIRVRNTKIEGCRIAFLPAGTVQQYRTAFLLRGRGYQNLMIRGCSIENVFRGTRIFASDGFEGRPFNVTISGNDFVNCSTEGLKLAWNYDSMPLYGCVIEGNKVSTEGTIVPIELDGPWQAPTIRDNISQGGVGTARALLLSSEHACFGHGPRNPEVLSHRWERFAEPVMQYRQVASSINICESQSRGSAGALTLNGIGVIAHANISPAAAIQVKSDATDNSGLEFSIGGFTQTSTGLDGGYFGATVIGPTAGGTKTFKYDDGTDILFTKVFFVSHSTTTTGAVRVGTAADDDAVCLAQSAGSARELVINGVAVFKQALFGGAKNIMLTCAGNESANYFWIYGRDEGNNYQNEKIAGGAAGTYTTRGRYRAVHRLSTNVATVGTVKLGIASDDDCICLAQSYSGDATLNGVLAVNQASILERAGRIAYASLTGNNSAVNFTVVGTDDNGEVLTETRAGANSTGTLAIAYGTARFKTVASVSSSAATIGNVSVGTSPVVNAKFTDCHQFGSAGIRTIQSTDSPYTALLDDEVLFVNTTQGAVTINLPSVALYPFKRYFIRNIGTGGNSVTLAPNGADTVSDPTLVDAEATITMNDGATAWYEMGQI